MATKVLQVNNCFIHWDDTVYRLDDSYGGSNGHFTLMKISNETIVFKVYPDGMVKWDQPPSVASVVAIGQHLRIPLT